MRRRLRKVVGWGAILVVSIAVGGAWFAVTYATRSETLREAIRVGAPKFLPGSIVDAQSVHLYPFLGKVVIKYPIINQIEGGSARFVGISPWVELMFDPWGLAEGKFDLKEVVIAQPTLRIRRRKDGTWNLVGLLADPWPMPQSESTPPIRIRNGTVELLDESDGPDAAPSVVLREVSVTVSAGTLSGTPIRFEASARGDLFDQLKLVGTIDRASGRVAIAGDLGRLLVSKTLGDRLPIEARTAFRALGLDGGEADVAVRGVTYDPKARTPIRYDLTTRLRSGVWRCPNLPFPINDLSATVAIRDGVATIEASKGHSGSTTVQATGSIALGDPATSPFRVAIGVEDLEIDRVKDWSVATFKKVAQGVVDDFRPKGRVDVEARLSRSDSGGPIDWTMAVGCRGAAFEYREFKYPLDHVTGELICSPARITVDLHTIVAGKPVSAKGTIDRPGPLSTINLAFAAEALPIDKALLDAMPPDVRKVVDSFKPSGSVRGTARLRRTPPAGPGDDPRGVIAIHADLDINPGSEITWDGLKYPVRDLTGHLEIHPESWVFKGMRGTHGQATITGEGRVDRIVRDQYKVDLHINANNLLFETQLRDALQPAWRESWKILNPTGASDVDVTINLDPGKSPHYHIEIDPRPRTNLRLRFERMAVGDDAGGPREIEMPMEDVSGRFVFDDGTVSMTGGEFTFRNSLVKFDRGEVQVRDSGQFSLWVAGLRVGEFRIDAGLRKLMPPVMAQFALRVDNESFNIRTDLSLGWSGKPGEPATCAWKDGTVVFNKSSILAGIPLKHVQGQIDHLRGGFDGRDLTVKGVLDLGSVNVFDMQVTDLTSPIEVGGGKARLSALRGTLMKGELLGSVEVGLESTPKFEAKLAVRGADLQSYARSIPGKQSFRGLVSARVELSGLGSDLHSLQGGGEAHVTQGDLGELPAPFRVVSRLNLAPNAKTLFDQADVSFRVRNGQTSFDAIRFLGYAISLYGHGTMDVQGELNVPLAVVYSRDAWHIPGLSDLIREAEGQILTIRVLGTAKDPRFKREFLPAANELVKSIGDRRKDASQARRGRR